MRKSLLSALVAVAAAGVLAGAPSQAAAFPLNVSPAGGITARANRYTIQMLSGLINISCDMTINGTITSPIYAGIGMGTISSASVANCNYPVTPLYIFSWNFSAQSSLGAPPALTGMSGQISLAQFEIRNLPIVGTCLIGGTISFLMPISSGIASSFVTQAGVITTSSSCFTTAIDIGGQAFTLSPRQVVTR